MAKCCVVFSQSPFEDLAAFRVRHVLLLVSILTSNAPGQCNMVSYVVSEPKVVKNSIECYSMGPYSVIAVNTLPSVRCGSNF